MLRLFALLKNGLRGKSELLSIVYISSFGCDSRKINKPELIVNPADLSKSLIRCNPGEAAIRFSKICTVTTKDPNSDTLRNDFFQPRLITAMYNRYPGDQQCLSDQRFVYDILADEITCTTLQKIREEEDNRDKKSFFRCAT